MNKLIFRFLGAVSSALIIIAVFVPFINISGYTQSLWQINSSINASYLPIMLMVFGAIGVIFFALNFKTEFAYMTTGAVLFYSIMQTVQYMGQGNFGMLSMGYYFLLIGSVMTGVMAFLCNLRVKLKENVITVENTTDQPSMLNQIDKLYNESPQNLSAINTIQPVNVNTNNDLVQPIQNDMPIQPLQSLGSIPDSNPIPEIEVPAVPTNQIGTEIPKSLPQSNVIEPLNQQQAVNPVVQEFQPQPVNNQSQAANPVVQEFQPQPINNQPQAANPVVREFQPQSMNNQPQAANPVVQGFQPQPTNNQQQAPNPVVQEFDQTHFLNNQPTVASNPVSGGLTNLGQPQPQFQSNGVTTDIFGQPLDR